jgi:hypothetical protein
MKSTKKRLIFAVIGFLLLSSVTKAEIARLEISGSYFFPSEKAFRDIYGPGGEVGLDIGRTIWKNIEFHLEVRYFNKSGRLTFTQEKTRVKILPLGAHLRYVFLKKGLHLYAGVGLSYCLFQEKNPIGKVDDSRFGLSARIGGYKKIKGLKNFIKHFIIDGYVSYHYCEIKPAEVKVDIGGAGFGMALGFEF